MKIDSNTELHLPGDVEIGCFDSGLSEGTVAIKTVSAAPKVREMEDDDIKGDINCYGVGVIKMDN